MRRRLVRARHRRGRRSDLARERGAAWQAAGALAGRQGGPGAPYRARLPCGAGAAWETTGVSLFYTPTFFGRRRGLYSPGVELSRRLHETNCHGVYMTLLLGSFLGRCSGFGGSVLSYYSVQARSDVKKERSRGEGTGRGRDPTPCIGLVTHTHHPPPQ